MEVPNEVTAGVVFLALSAIGAIGKLWSQNSQLQKDLRICERRAGRALGLARYQVEKAQGLESDAPTPEFDDDEPTINRRARIDRDAEKIEEAARLRSRTDPLLRDYLRSDPPPGAQKTRIRFGGS